ncbi:MAG: sugar phosphate isomerase/epimerase [Planctomycetales bacterium]|nr:sugar phosphate isomerase/epimerase [Planctomycetales bacterium]
MSTFASVFDRRDALRRIACSVATGAFFSTGPLAGSAEAAAATPRGFPGFNGVELAIATICVDGFENQRHATSLREIPKLGFKNVEINVWYPDLVAPSYFDSLKARCVEAAVRPISLQGSSIGFAGQDGLVKDVAHKMLLIEGCRTLGCHIVKCTGMRRNSSSVDEVIATLREITPMLEERGVLFVLENHAGNVLERPDDFARILDAIVSPNVGLCLDPGHFVGVDVALADVIDRFGGRILHADLKDCRERGKGHDTVAFGAGVVDFDDYLQRLMESGFRGYLVVEQAWKTPPASWRRDLQDARGRFAKWES